MFLAVSKIFLTLSFLNVYGANQDVEFVKNLSTINDVVMENDGQCYKDLKQILNFVMLEDFAAIQSEFLLSMKILTNPICETF